MQRWDNLDNRSNVVGLRRPSAGRGFYMTEVRYSDGKSQCTFTETGKHLLQEALEELRGDYDIRGYSGRGMYGKQCLSINVSQCDMNILQLGFDLATTDA